MLKKIEPIEIKPDSPFDGDTLSRQDPVHLLTRLVVSMHQPFVLSVEAPWGFGKTTFIKLWKAHLESQKHVCFYFNAWENDFVDDPLIAFLGEMRTVLEEKSNGLIEKEAVRKHWGQVKKIGAGVLRKTLPLAIQIATHGLLNSENVEKVAGALTENSEEIGKFASELAKERFEKYEAEKEGVKTFRKNLEKLASDLTNGTDKKAPIIFFVDELDRCRPNFAIALLERVKHLFNVQNVIFVLAIDRVQLNQSVKALYGIDSKPDGYLRRFIDLSYELPKPEGANFAQSLFNRFGLQELNWIGHEALLLRSFSEYSAAFGLSLRTQEQCFMQINLALRTNPKFRNFPFALSFYATLRAYNLGVIEDLRASKIEIETVLGWISIIKNEDCRIQAEAALRVEFSSEKNAIKLQEIQSLIKTGPIAPGTTEQRRVAQKLSNAMAELKDWDTPSTTYILSALRLSTQFR